MNKHIQTIIDKPMNRKEFLGYIDATVLAVIGVSGMLKALLNHSNTSSTNHHVADGYGFTPYGGPQKSIL